jgi:hypothetical protein
MAPKKKTRISTTKSKRTVVEKATPKKKLSKLLKEKKPSKKPAGKRRAPKKPIAKKKIAAKKTMGGKTSARKTKRPAKKKNVPKRTGADNMAFLRAGTRSNSGGQSGDLQGLSHRASVDSESVDELMEEGNAFEAGVVMGVEDAGNADEGEVHTHEVSEDDVPEEYLDDKE